MNKQKEAYIEIKSRLGSILWKSTKTTFKEALVEAINADANLTDANLTDADLTDTNLTGADLTDADLTRANLTRANLTDANLTRANLTDANLTDANLTRADLNGCLYYMGNGYKNFEALCKAIKTIRHIDGEFEDLAK